MGSQTKLINDILFLYENILENKKISEASDIYDNLDFKNIGIGSPASDNINTALLSDIDMAAKAAGVKVDITTAVSGHKSLPSRHPSGNAVDISIINGKAVSPSNRSDADKFVAALVSMGYSKNEENSSNPKAVLTFGVKGHDDHVHVSNTTSTPSTSNNAETKKSSGARDFAKSVGKELLGLIGIKESIDSSSLGRNIKIKSGGEVKIPSGNNSKIKSPVDGVVVSSFSNSNCNNKTTIKFNDSGYSFYLEYCGISNPSVSIGNKLKKGDTIGKTDSDVGVVLYDSTKRKVYFDNNKSNKPKDSDPSLSGKNEYSKMLIKAYRGLKKSFDKDSDKIEENIKRIKSLL